MINDILNNFKNENYLLIDVRYDFEYEMGHIPGAINLPLNNIIELENLEPLKDRTILLYCASGNRSEKALAILRANGYINAINIGGIGSYKGQLEK